MNFSTCNLSCVFHSKITPEYRYSFSLFQRGSCHVISLHVTFPVFFEIIYIYLHAYFISVNGNWCLHQKQSIRWNVFTFSFIIMSSWMSRTRMSLRIYPSHQTDPLYTVLPYKLLFHLNQWTTDPRVSKRPLVLQQLRHINCSPDHERPCFTKTCTIITVK